MIVTFCLDSTIPLFAKCFDKLHDDNNKAKTGNANNHFMLTKRDINLIKALQDKKERYQQQLFVAEGNKVIIELLAAGFEPEKLLLTEAFAEQINLTQTKEVIICNKKEIEKVSTLKSTRDAVGIFSMIPPSVFEAKTTIALDHIQDPGNLGTIIRIADWYGIKQIVCSPNSADVYNAKTIMSTMGSLARVKVLYLPLNNFLKDCKLPVYGASLSGESIYTFNAASNFVLLIGNEGHGIDNDLKEHVSAYIHIPRLGGAESLNAAVATAVLTDRLLVKS